MFHFFQKNAAIVRVDQDNNVEVSDDLPNVQRANHALSTHLSTNGAITVKAGYNDHDGKVVTAIEKSPFKAKTWYEIEYELMQRPDFVDEVEFAKPLFPKEVLYLVGAYGTRSEVGRTSAVYTCPICGTETRCFLWSLAGGGKKCGGCNAVLTMRGAWLKPGHPKYNEF